MMVMDTAVTVSTVMVDMDTAVMVRTKATDNTGADTTHMEVGTTSTEVDMVVTEEVTVTTEVDMGVTEEVMVTTEVDMVVTANTAGKWKPEANKATELKELETKVLEPKEPTVNKISQVIANVFLNCFILDKNEIILLQFDFKAKNCSFAYFLFSFKSSFANFV